MKKYLTYLASPYSHPDKGVRVFRFEDVTRAAAWLINTKGWNVFSPITHSHPLHDLADLRGDWAFWKKIDTEYIKMSARLVVLNISGWDQSVGVLAEIKIAKKLGLPIFFLKLTRRGYKLAKIVKPSKP